jgi:hypothetical protein
MTTSAVSVATRTELKNLDVALDPIAFLSELGRQGLFGLKTGNVPQVDPEEAIYIISTTPGYYWQREFSGAANLTWFGASIEAQNNWTPFQNAITLCGRTGIPLYIPTGRFSFTDAPQIKVDDFKTAGLIIFGDGQHRTILDVCQVATSPSMILHCTTCQKDNYYLTMRDIGIEGKIAGTVFQIGEDDFGDPVNMPRFQNVSVQNFDTTSCAIGVRMNYVVGGWFDMQINCGSGGRIGGNGIALILRQCGFCHFFGSYGTSEIAVQLQDGFNFGNVFNCLDMENVKVCVRINSGEARSNTFVGGQWSFSTAGIDARVGLSNMVINPNLAPNASVTAAHFLAATVGLTLQSQGIVPFSSPALPASGVTVMNETARQAKIAIWGGSIQAIVINNETYPMTSGFVTLEPMETIAITYSSPPSWKWRG